MECDPNLNRDVDLEWDAYEYRIAFRHINVDADPNGNFQSHREPLRDVHSKFYAKPDGDPNFKRHRNRNEHREPQRHGDIHGYPHPLAPRRRFRCGVPFSIGRWSLWTDFGLHLHRGPSLGQRNAGVDLACGLDRAPK